MKVKAPQAVIDGIEEVRKSGKTNMFDRRAVQYWADKNEAFETVCWLEEHPREYGQGLFNGFEPE